MVMAATREIEFWFDFSSPYAYFASHRVETLLGDTDRSVVWRPFMLGTVFRITGAQPLVQIPAKGEYCRHDWDRLAQWYGVPWSFPDPFPIATLAAGRAFYWLTHQDTELAKRFARLCFHTYFGEGRSISDAAVVAGLAETLGVDGAALLVAVDDPVWKQRLKAAGEEAIGKGVIGAPFVIADGEGFWGNDRLEMVADWLRRGGR